MFHYYTVGSFTNPITPDNNKGWPRIMENLGAIENICINLPPKFLGLKGISGVPFSHEKLDGHIKYLIELVDLNKDKFKNVDRLLDELKEIDEAAERAKSNDVEYKIVVNRVAMDAGEIFDAYIKPYTFYLFIAVIGIYFLSSGKLQAILSSKPSCEVISRNIEPYAFIVDNQADAGFRVIAKIRKINGPGKVEIYANLSTSEGAYERKQVILLKDNEVRSVTFGFHEPTVNATNVQAVFKCK